jgi:DNA-3-methyladenine glycosylase II
MNCTLHFGLNDTPIQTLCEADARLAVLIRRIGDVTLPLADKPFESLAMSIIGQQLSPKAAGTIKSRVRALLPDFTPETVLHAETELFRSAGVSGPKTAYIKDLSAKVLTGDLQFDGLDKHDEETIVELLTRVKGIGRWTAEMFLIFSLGKLDVMSTGDAGLQRSAKWLFQMEDRPDRKYLEQHAPRWAPYRSVASLYLWEAIDSGLIAQPDL